MNNYAVTPRTHIAPGKSSAIESFVWLDRQRNKHIPRDMETRHLFFTLRMIWNNRMPHEARTCDDYTRYYFPDHPDDYLKQAVTIMLPLLLQRTDLKPSWIRELNHMLNYFKDHKEYFIDQDPLSLPDSSYG